MANGTSKIQGAQNKMTSVNAQFTEARATVNEWAQRFEEDKEELLGQMGGSHDDAVEQTVAIIDEMLEELRKADELLAEMAEKAAHIEAEL